MKCTNTCQCKECKKEILNVTLDAETRAWFKAEAKRRKITMARLMEWYLIKWVLENT